MDGLPVLPPVDLASWADYQRRRAEQFARDRIASVGAPAADWVTGARRSIAGLLPDWALPGTAQPAPAPPPITPAPLPLPEPVAAAEPWAPPPQPAPALPPAGRFSDRPLTPDWTQSAAQRVARIVGDLPGAQAVGAMNQRQLDAAETTRQRFIGQYPELPPNAAVLRGVGEAGLEAIRQQQARDRENLRALTGQGPEGPEPTDLGRQLTGGVGYLTPPQYRVPGAITGDFLHNVGATPELQAAGAGLAGTIGPGGTISSIRSGLASRGPAALRALPAVGAGVGGIGGVATGIAAGAPPEEVIARGAEGANLLAGAGELGVGVLPAVGQGVRALAGRAGGLARRYGRAPEDELGAVAGFGRPSIKGAPSGARFGIENAVPEDIEGQVARSIAGAPEEVRAIQGAPGSGTSMALDGAPRVFSPYEVPPGIARRSHVRLEPRELDEVVNPRLAGAERAAPENLRRVTRTVRSADTLYDYLSGMADDYAGYRDFYPDFGRFYRSLAEPAGDQADGVFNELSALWAATAAQTAPHDNLTKALMASLAARRFRDAVGRLPTAGEVYRLLMEGKIAPGATITGGGNRAAWGDLGEVVGEAPDVALKGPARKLTMEDAKKIAETWETGRIEIPSNFKLTAFNLLNALAARAKYSPFSVIDTHMFRLFGYKNPGDAGGSPEASRFVQATIERLAQEKGWSPHQVQSALWYGAKNEVAPPNAMGARFADKATLAVDTFGIPKGTTVDDGTLAYSVEKNRALIDRFLREAAPKGAINENAARATVVFPGKSSKRGRPAFSLDDAAQQRAETWMENRGYTFTTPVSDAALRALDYDPRSGTLGALAERNIPARVVQQPDGTLAVQLYTQSDAGAREAAELVGGTTGARLEPIRPLLDSEGPGATRGATGRVFQIDKADGGAWTRAEIEAARRAGVQVTLSPDGLSLVARADDLAAGVDAAGLQRALAEAGTPPLDVSEVPVRAASGGPAAAGEGPVLGATSGPGGGPGATVGDDGVLARTLASLQPYGAARTRGERTFDLAGGTLGGLAGAATADEDAPWQERAKRAALGASAGALVGPTARGGLGLLTRLPGLAGEGQGLAGPEADDVLGAVAGGRRRIPEGRRPGRRPAPSPPPRSRLGDALGDITTVTTGLGLANPASLGANLTGGITRTAQRVARELAGETGNPLHAAVDVAAMFGELPSALATGLRAVVEGPNAGTRGLTGPSVGRGLENSRNPLAVAGTIGLRVNSATDAAVRALNEAGAAAVARRRGLDPATAAQRAGDFATYQLGRSSPLADLMSQARGWISAPDASPTQRLAGGVVYAMAPYVRMPERLLVESLKTLSDPVTQAPGLVRAVLSGDKEAMRQARARIVVGAVANWGLYNLWQNGQLTGDPPSDPTDRRQREAQGAKWNTLSVDTPGGRVDVPLRFLGDFGQSASALATTMDAGQQAIRDGNDPWDVFKAWGSSALKWTLSESYLRDLARFGSDVLDERGADTLERVAAGTLTRPAAAVAPLTALDPYEREAEGFAGQAMARVPGLRQRLPTRIDPTTGEAQRRVGTGASRGLLGDFGSEQTPEARELARLRVNPRAFAPGEEYAGSKQTAAQRRVLGQAFGSETGKAVRETVGSAAYQRADDEAKARLLRSALRRAADEADVVAGDRVARDAKSQAQRAWDAVPRFVGVPSEPDAARRENARIQRALTLAETYRKQYGEGSWRSKMSKEEPGAYALLNKQRRDATVLANAKQQIEAKYGVQLG